MENTPTSAGQSSSALSAIMEQLVAALASVVLERVQERLPLLSPSSALDIERTKEALSQVVNAALFGSGVLEKVVSRQIEQKLQAMPGVGAAGGPGEEAFKEMLRKNLPKILKEEIQEAVERQVQATLSGEAMKVLVDDKFRAISLYLKGEVIPKTVAQLLKESKQPA